jgi:hypothetical protein
VESRSPQAAAAGGDAVRSVIGRIGVPVSLLPGEDSQPPTREQLLDIGWAVRETLKASGYTRKSDETVIMSMSGNSMMSMSGNSSNDANTESRNHTEPFNLEKAEAAKPLKNRSDKKRRLIDLIKKWQRIGQGLSGYRLSVTAREELAYARMIQEETGTSLIHRERILINEGT